MAPAAALELSRAQDMIRRSPTFSPPQRVEAKMLVARHCWALVMAARKEKGGFHPRFIVKDAVATSQAPKVETVFVTSAVDIGKRDEEARRAAQGGGAGGRQLAAKGHGDQLGQGDKLTGKATEMRLVSRLVSVFGGGGLSAGAGRPAAGNPLRLGARADWSGGRRLGGRCRPCQMG